MTWTTIFAIAVALIWIYLMAGRGGFWLARERDDDAVAPPPSWPSVAVVIPARNEAEHVGETVRSLLAQAYPGRFSVTVVDDESEDGTAHVARLADAGRGLVEVLSGSPHPAGWTGKLWAMHQGFEKVTARSAPDFVLFTDADIAWGAGALGALVADAVAQGHVLSSLMVRLRCESRAERWLVPSFVFFFQLLYPFACVNRRSSPTAAAAGGVMLVRPDALARAGGLTAIRHALIDDCALGALMKAQGPIRLALTQRVRSLRAYGALADIRDMVVRSAYAQLNYSPLLLAGCLAGMALTYLAPPLLALFAPWPAALIGLATWLAMAISMAPILRFYAVSPLRGLALPAVAFLYSWFTLKSGLDHARGRGGMWKGRAQAIVTR
jgi:hopene-associated glycosyltransferase HpnB